MLDDTDRLSEMDPDGMARAIAAYPQQLRAAATMTLPDLSRIDPGRIRNVCFLGMGGSGAGAEYAMARLDAEGHVPARVVHDYDLPTWVERGTLVVATSYSGGTEETLGALADALKRDAQVVCISTGGALGAAAGKHDLPFVQVPGGLQPRAAFGYLSAPGVRVLAALGLLDAAAVDASLQQAVTECESIARANGVSVGGAGNRAKNLAESLHAKTVVLVADTPFAPVAERVRCQINENSKTLAFARVLPEANHNDTVAWTVDAAAKSWVALFVGPFDRLAPLTERARFVRDVLEARGVPVHDLDVPVADPLARMLAVTYLGDWVSLYLAFLNGEDPSDVSVIPRLKERCAKTGWVSGVKERLGL